MLGSSRFREQVDPKPKDRKRHGASDKGSLHDPEGAILDEVGLPGTLSQQP